MNTHNSLKVVILDRDGVINRDSDDFIKSADEWHPIPGSLEAIARLSHAGYRVVVATNQSGIARGLFTIETLNGIHQKLHDQLARVGGQIDFIGFCPHGPDDGCECRKPKPGLFHQIGSRLNISLRGVPAIGDSLRDLLAAHEAGATPILVRSGKGRNTEQALEKKSGFDTIPVFDDLSGAVDALLT